MSETVDSCVVKLTSAGTVTGDADIGARSYSFSESNTKQYTHGTGAGQVNMIWTDSRTLSASSSEDLDLAGGLTSALGTTITFTKIKSITIEADSGNTNNVLVGGGTNGISSWVGNVNDILVVRPGAMFCLACGTADSTGYAVTATTGDILKIANSSSGSSVTYKIKITGVV